MVSKSLKSLFYRSYEIGFIKSDIIAITVYQENFQTLIGSKDGITPFNYPIITEFKYKQNALNYIIDLINEELRGRKK